MLGKLTWAAIPFDQPIPLFAAGLVGFDHLLRPRLRDAEGLGALSLAGVDHQRRSQADRRDVRPARRGHAAARLHRRDHDALAAGAGVPVAGLPAARALRPDLLGPRHADDLLRRDAVRDRADERRRPVAARRARRGVPHAQLGQLLADGDRRAADQRLAGGGRVRAHRLAGLPAAVRADLFARRRRGLLPVVAADLRRGHAADRRQLRHHDPEDPRAGHDLYAHADVLLDGARLLPADRRGLPDPDGDLRHAAAGPLSRLPFLHQRGRRQHDDVHQPHLGLGTSGGLHPRPAGVRRVLRGGIDLLGQAAVRLPLDGHGDAWPSASSPSWSGCTTSSPWAPVPT